MREHENIAKLNSPKKLRELKFERTINSDRHHRAACSASMPMPFLFQADIQAIRQYSGLP